MAQGVLPFQYEVEKKQGGMTSLGGLPLYLDLMHVMGLRRLMNKHVHVRNGGRGRTDDEVIIALVLLNLAGGDAVDDLRVLEGDEGFCRVLREVEKCGRIRSELRLLKPRWRKAKARTLPSATVVREYSGRFHGRDQGKLREPHVAFIPSPTKALTGSMSLVGA
jgi:hypothetical protein